MGRKDREEGRPEGRGWSDYKDAEDVGERDGEEEVAETEEQLRQDADVDGDGRPEPTVGSSDDVSRDVETELQKDIIGRQPPD